MDKLCAAQAKATEALEAYVAECEFNEAQFSGFGDMIVPEEAKQLTSNAKSALNLINQ